MINNILQLPAIPENPTLNWALLIAITGLVTAVIYLFKELQAHKKEKDEMRDKHEERLLIHAKDIQGLLERVLLSFAEIEKNIMTKDIEHLDKLKDIMLNCADKLEQKLEKNLSDGNKD